MPLRNERNIVVITRNIIILIVMSLLVLSGCARTASIKGYVKPGLVIAPMKPVDTIAIFPFDNISGHPDASKKVGNLLLTELVRMQSFRIAEIGEVENSLRTLRLCGE